MSDSGNGKCIGFKVDGYLKCTHARSPDLNKQTSDSNVQSLTCSRNVKKQHQASKVQKLFWSSEGCHDLDLCDKEKSVHLILLLSSPPLERV